MLNDQTPVSLQLAYGRGSTITTLVGTPVTLSTTAGNIVLDITSGDFRIAEESKIYSEPFAGAFNEIFISTDSDTGLGDNAFKTTVVNEFVIGFDNNNNGAGSFLIGRGARDVSSGSWSQSLIIDNAGRVKIGTGTPNASSQLDIVSTTRGFLMPRMTTAQRDAIASPATGLEIYNTSTNQINYYDGTTWQILITDASENLWDRTGTVLSPHTLGDSIANVSSLTMDNGATDGGAIYFDGGTTSFLKSNAAGTTLIASFDAYFVRSETVQRPNLSLANYNSAVTSPLISFQKFRGTLASPASVVSGDEVGRLRWTGAAVGGALTAQDSLRILGEVQGTVTATAVPMDMVFETGTGSVAPTERMRITTAGLVGLGTETPEFGLNIVRDAAHISIDRYSSSQNGPGYVGRHARGTVAIPLALLTDDVLTTIGGRGYDGTAFSTTTRARLDFRAAEDWSITEHGAYMSFNTTEIGTVINAEKMRLTDAGTLAINTTAPSASAILQTDSTTKGFLPPRMTTAQRNAISSPASGLMVFNTTTAQWEGYNGTSWVILG